MVKRTLAFFIPLMMFFFPSGEAVAQQFNPEVTPADSLKKFDRPHGDSIIQFNQFGSFGLFSNGISASVRTDKYTVAPRYNYRNFDGYRVHSNEYSHTLNLMLETTPSVNTTLQITGNYFTGADKRPGSLTKSEFGQDPFQADPRAVNRDEKRVATRENLDINYSTAFGKSLNQKIEISGNGVIEYFERSTREYKITTRYIMGVAARYIYTGWFWHRKSEFTVGGGLLHQPERKEEYENFSGQKSDWLEQIESEKTSTASCYLSENFEVVQRKLFALVTGRYNHVIYSVAEQMSPSLSDTKRYDALTPELALNYIVIPAVTLFASYEVNFRNPTDKELESPNPASLYNRELMPQTSAIVKAGFKTNFSKKGTALFFKSLYCKAYFFSTKIDKEIVPYEIFGDEYFRNATRTTRYGVVLESRMELYKELFFSVDYAYAHYIYNAYTANSWETDSTGNIVNIYRDFAGKSEPNIPRNKLGLSLYYKHPVGKKTGIFVKASYQYLSGLWVDDGNTGQTGSYSLVNAVLGFDIKLKHFIISASGGVNNLFDQVYAGYANINSADKRFYNAGAPRNFPGSVNIGYVF